MDIRVKRDTPLTIKNVVNWVVEFETFEKIRRQNNKAYYLKAITNGLPGNCPLPKKLVLLNKCQVQAGWGRCKFKRSRVE